MRSSQPSKDWEFIAKVVIDIVACAGPVKRLRCDAVEALFN
jgi:hypothetical protein